MTQTVAQNAADNSAAPTDQDQSSALLLYFIVAVTGLTVLLIIVFCVRRVQRQPKQGKAHLRDYVHDESSGGRRKSDLKHRDDLVRWHLEQGEVD